MGSVRLLSGMSMLLGLSVHVVHGMQPMGWPSCPFDLQTGGTYEITQNCTLSTEVIIHSDMNITGIGASRVFIRMEGSRLNDCQRNWGTPSNPTPPSFNRLFYLCHNYNGYQNNEFCVSGAGTTSLHLTNVVLWNGRVCEHYTENVDKLCTHHTHRSCAGGAVLAVGSGASFHATRVTFYQNGRGAAPYGQHGYGGALAVEYDAQAYIADSLFHSNRAYLGGAIYLKRSKIYFTDGRSSFVSNHVQGAGTSLGSEGARNTVEFLACSPGKYAEHDSTDTGSIDEDFQGCRFSCAAGHYGLGYSLRKFATDCVLCPIGSYCESGGTSLELCPAGRFGASTGLTRAECSGACDPGHYCPKGSNSSEQVACPAGRYVGTTGTKKLNECRNCTGGSECAAGSFFETPCSPGTYALPQAGRCTSCPGGYISAIWETECTPCPRGTYSDALQGSTRCISCDAGRFSTTPTSSTPDLCIACPVARYSSSQGATSSDFCIACPAGTFSTTPGANSTAVCKTCTKGHFSHEPASTSCTTCPDGYVNSQNGSSDCVECGASYFFDSTRVPPTCTLCEAGFFSQGGVNARGCLSCPAGYTSRGPNNARRGQCVPCPQGSYSNRTAVTMRQECQYCPPGRYGSVQALTSISDCEACPVGKSNPSEGGTDHSACKMCVAGRYSPYTGASKCISQPPYQLVGVGAASVAETPAGWYVVCQGVNGSACNASWPCPGGTKSTNPPTDKCIQCPPGRFSTTGSVDCQVCRAGTFAARNGTADCEECDKMQNQFSSVSGSTQCSTCQSTLRSTGDACILRISQTLPSPQAPAVMLMAGGHTLNISWTSLSDNPSQGARYDLRYSFDQYFPGADNQTRHVFGISKPWTTVAVDGLGHKLWRRLLYVQVRTVQTGTYGIETSLWSPGSSAWMLADACTSRQYLDSSSLDPRKWSCMPCPRGASCEGPINQQLIQAMFGFWRLRPDSSAPFNSVPTFAECLYPAACLGAPNPELAGKYFNSSEVDLALSSLAEGCNHYYGFARDTTLCHKCGVGFQRSGRAECRSCPGEEQNTILLVLGIFVVALIVAIAVVLTIQEGGRTQVSDVVRKITLSWLQVSAIAYMFPLKWPDPIKELFAIQGAISTVGEHLMSPDCSVTIGGADLLYVKQMVYASSSLTLLPTFYLCWRLWACIRRHPFRPPLVPGGRSHKDRYVVTVLMILYLLWPTLVRQPFKLVSCIPVDNRLLLLSDLDEECFTGRHQVMVLSLGIPQLLAHVLGLPCLGLIFVWRHRHELEKNRRVIFRYGVLFSGYRRDRWFWEACVALRKLLIVAVGVFAHQIGLDKVPNIAMFLLVVFACLHLIFEPYAREGRRVVLHWIDFGSLGVCWFTMWAGQFYFLSQDGISPELTSLTAFVIMVNVSFMILLVYVIVREILHENRDSRAATCFRRWLAKCGLLIPNSAAPPRNAATLTPSNVSQLEMTNPYYGHAPPSHAAKHLHRSCRGTKDAALKSRRAFGEHGELKTIHGASPAHAPTVTTDDRELLQRKCTLLPAGWSKHRDDDGRRYYFDQKTETSQWSMPPGATKQGTQDNVDE